MMTHRERERMNEEHLRRMSEPEPYRTLRLQKERIEREREEEARKAYYDAKAEQLRREIRKMGYKPEA
jgi:hypothetical protein